VRYLGIDLGTSFLKGAVLDLDLLSIGPVRRVPCPPPVSGLPPTRAEFNPEGFVIAARQMIEELLVEAPDCRGLLTCGQMGGLVLVSPEGKALSNYISWQDRRLVEPHPSGLGSFYDLLTARLSPDDWCNLGREIRPGTPLSYLFWLAEAREPLPTQAFAATLPDFVLSRLCGTSPATHPSNATGAINVLTGSWDFGIFDRLGFGHIHWPALREANEILGEIRRLRVPCHPAVGDHSCALAGVLLEEGELSLNISTGSQVSMRSEMAEPGDYQTTPFFDGQFIHRISHLPAGRALDALLRVLTELARSQGIELRDPWSYISKAAEAKTGTNLRANLAFFPTPLGDSGSLTNLREDNLTVGDLFQAAFLNMADNYHKSAQRLSPAQSWIRLVFSGGLAQKLNLLRSLIIEKFRCPHRLGPCAEDTLNGLLVLALFASGRTNSVEEGMNLLRRGHPPS
jgi:sugar (pentulose or hexulose) kinase